MQVLPGLNDTCDASGTQQKWRQHEALSADCLRDLTGVLHAGPDCETNNPYFPDYYFPGNGAVVGSGQIPIAANNNNNNNNNAAGGKEIMLASTHSRMAYSVTSQFQWESCLSRDCKRSVDFAVANSLRVPWR